MKGDSSADNENGSREDTSTSKTCNGSTYDECCRGWSYTTNKRSKFEDKKGNKENPFEGIEGIKFAVDKLECASREKIHRDVPTYIIECLEMICDFRNCRCDDCVVQSNTED
jgi:hypothetical protein